MVWTADDPCPEYFAHHLIYENKENAVIRIPVSISWCGWKGCEGGWVNKWIRLTVCRHTNFPESMHQNANRMFIPCRRLSGDSSCRQINFILYFSARFTCGGHRTEVFIVLLYRQSPHTWIFSGDDVDGQKEKAILYMLPGAFSLTSFAPTATAYSCNCSRQHIYARRPLAVGNFHAEWYLHLSSGTDPKMQHSSERNAKYIHLDCIVCLLIRTCATWLHSSYFAAVLWTASVKNNYKRLIAVWS